MRVKGRSTRCCATALLGATLVTVAGPSAAETEKRAPRAVPGLPANARSWEAGKLSGPIEGVPVRNFGVVSPGCLYRSAQPRKDEDYNWLIGQGFKGIV